METDSIPKRCPLLPHDQVRLEYGRLLGRRPRARERLLQHWLNELHPYRQRSLEKWEPLVERLLESGPEDDDVMDAEFRQQG